MRLLNQLKNGYTLHIGSIKFNDSGIFLKKEGNIHEEKFFSWTKPLDLHNNNALFTIELNMIVTAPSFSLCKYSASASYIGDMNTRVLEFIVRQYMSLIKDYFRVNKLSDLLDSVLI